MNINGFTASELGAWGLSSITSNEKHVDVLASDAANVYRSGMDTTLATSFRTRLMNLPVKLGIWPLIAKVGGLSKAYLDANNVTGYKHLTKADAIAGLIAEASGRGDLERLITEQEQAIRNGTAKVPVGRVKCKGTRESEVMTSDDSGAADEGREIDEILSAGKPKAATATMEDIVRQIAEGATGKMDEARVRQIAREEAVGGSVSLEIKVGNLPKVSIDKVHHRFESLLRLCNGHQPNGARLNVYMHGPAATGKTTAAKKVAEALGLEFYLQSSLQQDYQVLGHMHGAEYVRSIFRQAWENGGVILLDEMDGFGPNATLVLNGGLDGTTMAFPDGMVERHKDCIILGAGNTLGRGGSSTFSGRARQDGAFMDRWVPLSWEHDDKLEDSILGVASDDVARDWVAVVRAFRKAADAQGIRDVQLSTRASIKGLVALKAGVEIDLVKEMILRQGLEITQWQRLVAEAK